MRSLLYLICLSLIALGGSALGVRFGVWWGIAFVVAVLVAVVGAAVVGVSRNG